MTIEELTKALQVMRAGMKGAGSLVLALDDDVAATSVTRSGETWTIDLASTVLAALQDPNGDAFEGAALALAHATMHTLGAGPGFVRPEEQFLEEAIVELLAIAHLPEFLEALGAPGAVLEPLLVLGEYDLELARPVAAAASVERLARLLVWLSNLEDADDDDGWWQAVVGLAGVLLPLAGDARFSMLATAGAAKADPAADAEEDTAETLEEYLRGYLRQLRPSDTGFAALDGALDFAAFGEKPTGMTRTAPAREDWQRDLAELEGVVMEPMPGRERLEAALERAGEAEPEIAAAVDRSLDARVHLWAARNAANPSE